MLRILANALSGMQAQEIKVGVIAHNLANSNTPAFKKSTASFVTLTYQELAEPGEPVAAHPEAAPPQAGTGVKVAATPRFWKQGILVETARETDLAVVGDGFFAVELPSGELAFTRAGNFTLNPAGNLVTPEGYSLAGISLPPGLTGFTVRDDGTILVQDQPRGKITLYQFPNAEGLEARGENLFLPTPASGAPAPAARGSAIWQGYLEMANVELAEEMVNMILAQRAYALNARVVRFADELWALANSLRR